MKKMNRIFTTLMFIFLYIPMAVLIVCIQLLHQKKEA